MATFESDSLVRRPPVFLFNAHLYLPICVPSQGGPRELRALPGFSLGLDAGYPLGWNLSCRMAGCCVPLQLGDSTKPRDATQCFGLLPLGLRTVARRGISQAGGTSDGFHHRWHLVGSRLAVNDSIYSAYNFVPGCLPSRRMSAGVPPHASPRPTHPSTPSASAPFRIHRPFPPLSLFRLLAQHEDLRAR